MIITSVLYSQSSFEKCVNCENNILEGKHSSAVGIEHIVGGHYGFAGGESCNVNGEYAFAFGKNNIAGKRASFALGENSEANGMYSIAMGFGCKATGNMGVAMGFFAEANSSASLALGKSVKTSATSSFAIGRGYNEQFLENNVGYSLMIGINSTLPTFFVSASQGGSDKTGKIGIGNVTAPEEKLHIKADNNEDAAIKLQPTGSGYYGKILFGDDNHVIYSKTGEDLMFTTEPDKNFIFENGNVKLQSGFELESEAVSTSQIKAPDANGLSLTDQNGSGIFVEDGGNVGIGTTNPAEKLEVNGIIKASGMQLTDGTTNTNNHILISDQNGLASWADPAVLDDGDWYTNGNGEIYHSNTNVGIGTPDPIAPLEVSGDFVVGNLNKKFIFHSSWSANRLLIAPLDASGAGENNGYPIDL